MAITKEQVFQAADALAASGKPVTLAGVREEIGTGSFTTLSPYFREWKAALQSTPTSLREPAPKAIGDRLAALGADVWDIALELSNGRLASAREALEVERLDMEAQTREATELADLLSDQLEGSKALCTSLTSRVEIYDSEVGTLHNQLIAVQAQAHTAEARAVEIERRADDLNAALISSQEQVKRSASDLEAERQRHEASSARLGFATTELVSVKARAEAADQTHQEQSKQADADLDAERQRHINSCQRLDAALAELATIKAKADAANQAHQEQRKQSAGEVHRAVERMTRAETERDEARNQTSAAREEAAKLRGKVEALQAHATERLPPAQLQSREGAK